MEIPKQEWNRFFNSFSQQHEGWLATLEVFDANLGAQEAVRELPLEGVSVGGDDSKIIVMVGDSTDHLSHTIEHPQQVWLQKTSRGVDVTLEITSQDESKMLLSFRSPMLPELVDDIM